MGAAASTNVQETITESISKTIISVNSECEANTRIVQKLNISDISGEGCDITISGVEQASEANIVLNCNNENELISKIKNNLDESLSQKAKAESTFSLSGAVSKNLSNSISKFVNESNLSSVSSCIVNTDINQDLNISRLKCKNGSLTIKDISQTIIGKIAGKCIQENKAVAESVTEIEKNFKQDAEARNSAMGVAIIASVLCACSVCIVSIIMVVSGKTSGGGSGGGGGTTTNTTILGGGSGGDGGGDGSSLKTFATLLSRFGGPKGKVAGTALSSVA